MADQPAVTVRLATPRDATALAHLRYEFRAAIGDATEREGEFVERCARWMESHLEDADRWRCWVALEGDTLVGMAWVHLIEKVPNPLVEPEAHGYVTSLYVREHLRGAGVGARLLTAALDWCREHDVHDVMLWPTERSRSLYARFGFGVSEHVMVLSMARVDLDEKSRRGAP
jgi:GNAT superfamily N-acetyltransferase